MQYFLRRKVLDGDMSQYRCCQGYVHCCGFGNETPCPGLFIHIRYQSTQIHLSGETECPDLCLCFEAWLCNGFAVSASRLVIMDRFHLSSDPCDYRLIRISNALQVSLHLTNQPFDYACPFEKHLIILSFMPAVTVMHMLLLVYMLRRSE
jgi:hypothetical protein